MPPHLANFFVFLAETRFHHVGQAGLKLLTALASQSARITGVSNCVQPNSVLILKGKKDKDLWQLQRKLWAASQCRL